MGDFFADLLAVLIVGGIVFGAYVSQRRDPLDLGKTTLAASVSPEWARPSGFEQEIADPLFRLPGDVRPLVSGLMDGLRSVESLQGFFFAMTPSVFDELRSAIEAVVAYARESSPETASGLLETRLYDVRMVDRYAFEIRVFLGTPFTQASERTVSLIRQDMVLSFKLLPPSECEQCGAPLDGLKSCQFCGARIGEPHWRIVSVQPAGAGTSVLATGASFVGYRTPEMTDRVRAVS